MNVEDLTRLVMVRFLHTPPFAPDNVMTPESWTVDALCTQFDPEMFFPENGALSRDAKKICAACPVAAACLEFGMADQYGVYGGLTARQRRNLRNQRVA